MNVIIAVRNGVMDDPILVKKDNTAKAVYVDLAQQLGAELELHEIVGDSLYTIVDTALEKSGNELKWYVIKVNKF